MNQEHNHNTSDIEEDEDYVIKRDGTREKVSFDKILNRIKILGQSKHLNVNYTGLVMKIISLRTKFLASLIVSPKVFPVTVGLSRFNTPFF